MADLFKIKAGDTLKIPVEVTYADNAAGAPVRIVGDFMSTLVDGREEFWLPRSTVEAAEHIPAPRVFKRGDWVRFQNGNVVQMVVADDVDDELVWVTSDNPAQNILWRKQDCELTDAPE
jgi:hypothetical protein